jgi:hypothetical protein
MDAVRRLRPLRLAQCAQYVAQVTRHKGHATSAADALKE